MDILNTLRENKFTISEKRENNKKSVLSCLLNSINLGTKFITIFLVFATIISCKNIPKKDVSAKLLVNHLGYYQNNAKKFVLQTTSDEVPGKFQVVNEEGRSVFEASFEKGGRIDNWHTGNAYAGNFSQMKDPGKYRIITVLGANTIKSELFSINSVGFSDQCLSKLIAGFKHERCAAPYDTKDQKMTYFGKREGTIDVHGGWYDASGEKGKYLSHLCFTNYLCPQQTPMVVWNMLESAELYSKRNSKKDSTLLKSILEEAAYGADFLVRMQDEDGYFYTTIFANWSCDPKKREICAYEGSHGKKTNKYRAAFREGAGISIAALARISKSGASRDFDTAKYLEKAEKGYKHLMDYSLGYADDGKENIIDTYCALLAATELYAATNKAYYLEQSRKWMKKLVSYQRDDEKYKAWWSADFEGSRPYFHAAEAGLPLIALYRYLQFENTEELRGIAISAIKKSVTFELSMTNEVNNPYGYSRQYVKAVDSKSRASFFIPHKNETGYWWQGENARIASLASAFYLVQPYLDEGQKVLANTYATNQINWILGLNPYDVGMLEGIGRNNPNYHEGGDRLNYVGGVCNGITAGFTDETDIAFMPLPQDNDLAHKWRWSEQWIPHAGWFMLAVASSEM